jgi:cell division protein FtsN
MAEPERTTSFAKSVEGLHHEESALDRARSLRDQFVHAQNDNQKQKETEAEKPPAGSQMIRQDAPVLRPTPSGPMRQTPDRYAAATKLSKEHDNADAKIEAARKAQEAFKARQHRTQDHERDRDR